MKKIILIAIVVILIVLGVFIIKNQIQDKFNYEIEKISEYNYYVYKENEQFGVIDKDGNIIVEAKFTNIVIPNPRKRYFYLL